MSFVFSLLPGLVGTVFVIVPGMAILMIAVVASVVGTIVIFIFGPESSRCNQGRTE
jgi:hypothetical protein